MNELSSKGLLPLGLRDVLPPEAAFEAASVARLVACFESHGYERVTPPLIEFESSLLAGAGEALANQTMRLMDPVSQNMMGIRPDMTLQVARIAATRLKGAPRPLRLCYAGDVLRVQGSALRPERQFGQAGVELIGAAGIAADVEVVLLASQALREAGVGDVSVDLNMPTLIPALCRGFSLDAGQTAALRGALDRKDAKAVLSLGGKASNAAHALLSASGEARGAMKALAAVDLPDEAAAERARFLETAQEILKAEESLVLTLDAVEHRGFEYHTGVTFTLFSRAVRGELGNGGRYVTGGDGANAQGESATGFTLFTDTLMRALKAPAAGKRLMAPFGAARSELAALRAQGWQVVCALGPVADIAAEARRMGCAHALLEGTIVDVKK